MLETCLTVARGTELLPHDYLRDDGTVHSCRFDSLGGSVKKGDKGEGAVDHEVTHKMLGTCLTVARGTELLRHDYLRDGGTVHACRFDSLGAWWLCQEM